MPDSSNPAAPDFAAPDLAASNRDSANSRSVPTTPSPALIDLLARVIAGTASLAELTRQVTQAQGESSGNGSLGTAVRPDQLSQIDGATVDLGRQVRCGFAEVIYGQGKSAEMIEQIIQAQGDAGQSSLVTRVDSVAAQAIRRQFPNAIHNPLARTLRHPVPGNQAAVDETSGIAHAAVVTAGSTDAPVAEEAMETLAWMGVTVERFDDIGVAGPQRLLGAIPKLRTASAVVVIAGMEGALPAVVAGHLSVPIFAVPTSVGYGVNLGGLTPLLGMLSSCAANVAVVNIDAGFKAGYLAGMVVRQLEQAVRHREHE